GIRDGHVTGVQTCALPISKPAQNHLNDGFGADQNLSAFSAGRLKCCSRLSWLSQEMAVRDRHSSRVWPGCSLSGCGPKPVRFSRSEERRVGKECRFRERPK